MADDNDDIVWVYDPVFALAVLATVLYGICFIYLSYLTVIKYRSWYFLTVVIGAGIEVVGYALRSYSVKNQTQLTPFILTLTLVVLAPVFVAAGDYLLIGRLIRAVLPASQHRVLGIPARHVARAFVACDVVSFLVQGAGSGVAGSADWRGPGAETGQNILLAGLAFQVVTFAAYLAILAQFYRLARRLHPATADAAGSLPQPPTGWRRVLAAVCVSSALVLVRSVYRVAEFATGIDGYSFQHEWLFWTFEALPMLIAISVFCVVHPAKYLGNSVMARATTQQQQQPKGEAGSSDEGAYPLNNV